MLLFTCDTSKAYHSGQASAHLSLLQYLKFPTDYLQQIFANPGTIQGPL